MNITRFEYMLVLERMGTTTGAAKAYFTSPSAVSQCLKSEKAQPDHTLFKSENHRVVPAETGRIYLKRARKILKTRKGIMDKLNVIPQKHHFVRIAIAPVLYEKAVSATVPELNTRLPGIDFQLLQTDPRVDVAYLLNDLTDFALVYPLPLNHTLLTKDVLGEDQLLLVVPRAYLRGQLTGEPIIEDCNPLSFILLKSGTYTREIEDKILARHHIPLSRIYKVDSHITTRGFLEKGKGATFLPFSVIPDHAERHSSILPLKPPRTFNFILAYPSYTKPGKGKRDVSEVIRKVFNI